MSTIQIDNAGAIDHIEVNCPDGEGGVRIFRGHNGAGKTTALAVIAGLFGAKVDVRPSDDAPNGEASGFGRRLRVNKRVSATGKSKVPNLGNRLDIGKLVDPKVADPELRNKHRIRALVSLCSSSVDPESLIPEELQEYVDLDSASDLQDPVAMGDFLKRQFDAAARDVEKRCDVKAEMAKVKRVEAGDVDDLQEDVDTKSLADAYRAATSAVEEANLSNDRRKKQLEQNEHVEKQIAQAEESAPEVDVEAIAEKIDTFTDEVRRLQEELQKAKDSLAKAQSDMKLAKSHEDNLRRLKGMLVKEVQAEVEIAPLQEKAESAYKKLLDSEKLKDRKAAYDESLKLHRESVELSGRAEKLRNAAKDVQAEVQKLLPEGPILLEDGELVVQHGRRKKKVSYDELSTGEQTRIALGYAINAVGEGGVIPGSQEFWQSLETEAREEVIELCRENKVWFISAEVEDGPLRVEEL